MEDQSNMKDLKSWLPSRYRIVVCGRLDKSWSEWFAGMTIHSPKRSVESITTSLTGKLQDQSELMGVLNGLYELHLSILCVENLDIIEKNEI
jgi:hypothetical protein